MCAADSCTIAHVQVTVSEDVNADILAMVRGGGPTLGIITELTMRLFDVSNYHGVIVAASDPNLQQLGQVDACLCIWLGAIGC